MNRIILKYWVYIIKSKKGRLYIGSTGNIEKRIKAHNSGESLWTRRESGWVLIYSEPFSSRGEAMRREKQLKSGKGRDELRRKGLI